MKSRLIGLMACILWGGVASAAVYFNNSQGDNSFTNDLNWTGALGGTGGEAVDISGADQALLLTGETESRPYTLYLGYNVGTDGELKVDGGSLTVNRFIDFGYRGTGTVSLIDGSIQTSTYDINLGTRTGAWGTLNMSGGSMTAKRYFYVGEEGTGVMTMSGGTVNVTDYDFAVGQNTTGVGSLNLHGGIINATRDFIVGEKGDGTMTMTGGVVNAGGVFRVAEVAGSSGQFNFSGGTVNASDFKIESGIKTNGMVALSGSAEIVLPGNLVSTIQGYVDAGYLTGAEVNYIVTTDTTLVSEFTPPQQIDVSAYGAVPNDGQDDAAAIQNAVDAAGLGDTVVFDAGVYDLISSTNGAHISLQGKTSFILRGAVTNGAPATCLLRHVNLENRETLPQVIYNRDNTDITIENFIMDNSPRHTTAGTVVAKDPGGTWIRVQLFDDLPMDAGVGCYAANAWLPTDPPVFKNVRSLTYGTSPADWTIYDAANRIVELDAGSSQLDFIDLIDVNEIMSWHYGVAGDNMMYNGYIDGFTFRNIEVPNAINAFANLIYSRDIVLQDISFRSDNSCLAVGPRDGFHLSSNGGTLLIENVDIEGVRMDPIVLRTRYGHIDQITDSTNFHIEALTGGVDMPAGSKLGLWSSNGVLEYIEVASATWNSSPTSGYDIVSVSPLPAWAGVGTELKMGAFMPDDTLVTGCDFKNNAGTDVICFTDNVTFSNNTHFKATDVAIHLGSNSSDAGVCGNNVKILDSTFTDCGWGGKGNTLGAISTENRNSYQTPKVTNLEIRGNTFDAMPYGPAIDLRDIDGCEIASNTFLNVEQPVSIEVRTATDITVYGNIGIGGDDPANLMDSSGFTASASDSYNGREAVYAVNGAGMSDEAHVSSTPVGKMWMGANSSLPKWFKVDLGQSYDLDYMKIYNFNWAGYTSRGCRNVEIFYSDSASDPGNPVDNPGNWTASGSAFDLTQAPGEDTYGTTHPTQPDTVDLDVTARWVSIKINSHYGGSYCGLSEVRFWRAPNVPSGYIQLDPAGFTATASHNYAGREAVYAVNRAGLSGDAHTSTTPISTMWMGNSSSVPKWFKVDMGQSQEIDLIEIYNCNWNGYTSRGCRNVEIFYSDSASDPGNPVDNPGNWTASGSAFDLTQAPGDDTYGTTHLTRPDTVDLDITARWVALKINSHYGGSYNSLSEVRFWRDPNGSPIDPSGFTATASHNYSGREAVYAVNGAGLSGDAHTSTSANNKMWMGNSSTVPKWFKVDLAQQYDLDYMKIYNFNWAGYTSRGCRNVEIFYSDSASDPGNPVDNPGNWTASGSAFDLTQAPGDDTYGTTHPTQPDTVNLDVTARWVALKVNSHYGGSYNGLSEVRFWASINGIGAGSSSELLADPLASAVVSIPTVESKPPSVGTRISSTRLYSDNFVCHWDSVVGVNYNIWTNGSLSSGEWGIFDTVPGTGGSITWTSDVTDSVMLFYKVEQD